MGGIFVIKEIWNNYFFMKYTSFWHFHFCPSHNLYNVFFLMSFFLAEKHINKNSDFKKKKKKWRWGDHEYYVTSDLKWKKKYQFHILSWRENGNLKIMFTNFPFVPTVNLGFLCLINLAFIQLKNCSFIEIMTIPTQNEAVWLLYLLPCSFSWRPAMLRNYTTVSFHSGPFRVFE